MAALRAAARRLSCRLLSSSSSSSAAAPRLLGHFHNPVARDLPLLERIPSGPVFQPLDASSPRLSLDFVPESATGFSLFDSHLGLLLLLQGSEAGPHFLVYDSISRRHTLLPPPPKATFWDGEFAAAALLSRSGTFDFDVVCVTLHANRPRAWVALFRGGECRWRPLPRSRSICIDWPPIWVECRCVRAAGSLYWGICNNHFVLALDPATMEFSSLRAPALIWEDIDLTRYRIGEMPGDGRLCVAAMESDMLRICVRGEGSGDGWVLERDVSLSEVFDSVTNNPTFCPWIGGIDAGRTGRVFFRSFGHGHFSYDLDTGKLERLLMDEGKDFGHPIFAYFAAPGGGSGLD